MKTVKIPTCANPFVVIVNGIKYTYPAGATMEVPDDVAEVIEQHYEAHRKPASNGGGAKIVFTDSTDNLPIGLPDGTIAFVQRTDVVTADCLFNGVRLPGLPVYDRTVYPYAVIVLVKSATIQEVYKLIVSKEPTYIKYESDKYDLCGGSHMEFRYYRNRDSAWSNGTIGLTVGQFIRDSTYDGWLWANFDIQLNGETFKEASVPVCTEPMAADAYMYTNNNWYSHGAASNVAEQVVEQAKEYTDKKTEYAWSSYVDSDNYTFVNMANYIVLQNALVSPGGRVTLTADAGSDFEDRLSRIYQALNKGPCRICVGITNAGDVAGNRAFICLVPQVETAGYIATHFVQYEGEILILYMEFYSSQLTYSVQKLNVTPFVPAT